ncbi:hypothetical protein BDAP_002001 [Binucleata daphniae]
MTGDISNYKIIKKLASGAFGDIYLTQEVKKEISTVKTNIAKINSMDTNALGIKSDVNIKSNDIRSNVEKSDFIIKSSAVIKSNAKTTTSTNLKTNNTKTDNIKPNDTKINENDIKPNDNKQDEDTKNENKKRHLVIKAERNNRHKQLIHEFKVYQILNRSDNTCVAKTIDIGKIRIDDVLRYGFVMERLGLSLEEIFKYSKKSFSLKTCLMLADLLIGRIEYIHYKNYVHRDIKPDNFMFGRKKNAKNLYIIDFGLAKQYRNSVTYTHNKLVNGKSLVGTARYCSINAHLGNELSRRDDLESIGYCLVYFCRGMLPWQGYTGTKEEKYDAILKKKQEIMIPDLCDGMPTVFHEYFIYVGTLSYDETPNYKFLRGLFTEEMKKRRMKYDYSFEWDEWYNTKC